MIGSDESRIFAVVYLKSDDLIICANAARSRLQLTEIIEALALSRHNWREKNKLYIDNLYINFSRPLISAPLVLC